ncbi:MAG: dihydroneopterin aldolase [Flavobacteriales bacterium]|nr:dihydroneopterin aldolase [Flavobacteriales bacterium]
MAKILIENIQFFVKIGHLEVEHRVGNRIRLDVSFETDTRHAEETDELSDTVDYKAVFDVLKAQSEKPSKLIEHMARRMFDALVNGFPNASQWELKLAKLNPPVNGRVDQVSIVLKSGG